PEAGRQSQPAPGVLLWSWFNNHARLKIHDREHRVAVSIVEGDRARARVEVMENHPLTDDQKARILPPRTKAAPLGDGQAPPWGSEGKAAAPGPGETPG